jgi:hypothetical protein
MDVTISDPQAWRVLRERDLRVIVDPVVYRMGQLFLQGQAEAGDRSDDYWAAISNDIGGLVTFFDLLVLNDQIPAFNYTSTFDIGLNFDDSLGALVNRGEQIIVPIDVQWQAYSVTKEAAIAQYRLRMSEGLSVPAQTVQDILASIRRIEYEWEPNLEGLEQELSNSDQVRLAQFLIGVLVFAGYAQQSDARHVLSPRRSRLVTAAGLGAERADAGAEAALYNELARRIRDGGEGWRDKELPWTPSFLPYLVSRSNPYRDGPDILLKRAMELRVSPAMTKYRKLRQTALNLTDIDHAAEAQAELAAAADGVAKALDSSRGELEITQHILVDVLPKAVGAAGGAAGGLILAGPIGAVGGAAAGVAAEELLRSIQQRLFGWVLDRLPFYSARKLLTRAVRSDLASSTQLPEKLRIVWETGSRSGR